jgi:hypothetical protein
MSIKLFDTLEKGQKLFQNGGRRKSKKAAGAGRPKLKPTMSPDAIRRKAQELASQNAKPAANVSLSKEAKVKSQEASAKAEKAPEAEENPVPGNMILKDNDPSNTDVREKLKGVLESGMINFSDKEQQVLGQILKK